MAEFQEVMRQWKRRCEHCDANDNVRCRVYGDTCEAFYKMKDCTDFKAVEEEIMEWAAEHPEPVYPTWYEYLYKFGHTTCDRLNDPIPADVAEKLGLQPKNG